MPCYAVAAPIIPAAPTITADSYTLTVITTNHCQSETQISVLNPASLTKMMTAHILFEELKENNIALGDLVTIKQEPEK